MTAVHRDFAGNKVQTNDGPAVAPPIPLQVFGNAVYGGTDNEGNAPTEGHQQDEANEERQSVLSITSLFRAPVGEGESSGSHSADAASVDQNPLGNPKGHSTGAGYAANPDMVADMA
ncbi:hypothetical protein CCMA1212_008813 [Trichoderma ghanense]|uniref:Uncharacterized protein n=1 Tax=Trichoderma ghanense TaxID=65468 RepID=A0ABY2GW10_9HYPO